MMVERDFGTTLLCTPGSYATSRWTTLDWLMEAILVAVPGPDPNATLHVMTLDMASPRSHVSSIATNVSYAFHHVVDEGPQCNG